MSKTFRGDDKAKKIHRVRRAGGGRRQLNDQEIFESIERSMESEEEDRIADESKDPIS